MELMGFLGCLAFMFSVGAVRQQLGIKQATTTELGRVKIATNFVERLMSKKTKG